MRSTVQLIFIALIGCFGCTLKKDLSEGNWVITEGIYKGEKINFANTDLVQIRDINGNIKASLKFFEDGKIILPGINSSDISAIWKLIDRKLFLTIDTAKYNFIYKMDAEQGTLSSLVDDSQQKMYLDSLSRLDSINLKNWQKKNPLLNREFNDVIKVYSNPFEIEINKDNLTLTSKTTSLKAIKDRSLDKLFDGL